MAYSFLVRNVLWLAVILCLLHMSLRILLSHKRDKTIKYHGIDLMSLPTCDFESTFKNPCWRENGRLRCLPYFFIIGIRKCGTSELWRQIAKHPDFVAPDFGKDAGWFAKGRFNESYKTFERVPKSDYPHDSFDRYIDMFSRVARIIDDMYSQHYKAGTPLHPLITGDGSPSNLYRNYHWKFLPGNENLDEPRYVILDYIHHFLPKAKIIILFRDPAERFYSSYYFHYRKIKHNVSSSPEDFHQVVLLHIKSLRNCLKNSPIRSCAYDDGMDGIKDGLHVVFWRELIRLFPREQILAVQNKDLHDTRRVLHTVFKFLEMRIPNSTEWNSFANSHWNARSSEDIAKGDMLNETRAVLDEFFRPFNEEMFRETGDRAFLYRKS